MNAAMHWTRRTLLKVGAALGGGLLIGLVPEPLRGAVRSDGQAVPNPFAGWLRVGRDGAVAVQLPGTEMGQGHDTAMPMLVAEELEADWKLVGFELAVADPIYANPRSRMQSTTGSLAVRGYSEALRTLGAAARLMLVSAAALQWQVPASECRAEAGRVQHAASGRSAGYGDLADAAAQLPPPEKVPLKPPSAWKLLGKPTRRLDSLTLVTGRAVYGMDVQVPGMLVAAIAHSPVFGGRLTAVDDRKALAMRGVKAVVPLRGLRGSDEAVAVVADTYWHASQGLQALGITWDGGANAGLNDAQVRAAYRAALDRPGVNVTTEGDAAGAIAGAAQRVEATFDLPYLAHATLEPMNATAHVKPDGAELWVPTQSPGFVQIAVAELLGLPAPQVKVHVTFVGGGFGRRGGVDYAVEAAAVSKALGGPVKLIWSREEDTQHDFYRPAVAIRMEGGLDAEGRLVGLAIRHAGSSIAARLAPQIVKNGLDPIAQQGFADSPYEVPARKIDYMMTNLPVPVGFWRSVAHTYTGFAMECFMDQLAQAAGQDPVRFRLALLQNHPRHAAVLERVAQEAGWSRPLPKGRARGVALHEAMGSIVGQVAEISLEGQALKVHRVTAVVDCGLVVNPLTAEAQIKGGILFALTAAQYGEVNIDAGRVRQTGFRDYRLVRMREAPEIDVHFMQNSQPHGGIGEPGVPPLAPALVNALSALTGKRIDTLPLARLGYTLA